MKIVDDQIAMLGVVDGSCPQDLREKWAVAQMNRAVVLDASSKTRAEAADLYQQIGACPWIEPAAREQGWIGAIETLRNLGRWRDLASAGQAVSVDFPAVARIYRNDIQQAKQNAGKSGS